MVIKLNNGLKDVMIVKGACETYKELHGENFTVDDVFKDVIGKLSGNMNEFDVLSLICNITGKVYISANQI